MVIHLVILMIMGRLTSWYLGHAGYRISNHSINVRLCVAAQLPVAGTGMHPRSEATYVSIGELHLWMTLGVCTHRLGYRYGWCIDGVPIPVVHRWGTDTGVPIPGSDLP